MSASRKATEPVPGTSCAECGNPLSRYVVSEGDMFCSSVCAKTFHGVALIGSAAPMGRPAKGYVAKAKPRAA